MRNTLLSALFTASILFFQYNLAAQTPNLGVASSYALFTVSGAFGNSGPTNIIGDIGTNAGALTGFPPGTVTGQIHVVDSASALVAAKVDSAYSFLSVLTCDSTIGTTLGSNQVLTPHIYCIGGITTLGGTLTLNGQGNPNSIFIFKINGAFSTGSHANIILTDSATIEHVFWQVNGAFTLGDTSIFRGTLLVNGAINLLANSTLVGRGLSVQGAIALNNNVNLLPVELLSFYADCANQHTVLKWNTSSETYNHFFTIEKSSNGLDWYAIGFVYSKGNSATIKNYTFTDHNLYNATTYFRLKQTDFNGKFTYFKLVATKNCHDDTDQLAVYPNPAKGIYHLFFNGEKNQVTSIDVYNTKGEKVYASKNYQPVIDLTAEKNGTYYLHITLNNETIIHKILLEK